MCIKQFCYGKVINEMEHLDIHGRKKLLTGACYRAKIANVSLFCPSNQT